MSTKLITSLGLALVVLILISGAIVVYCCYIPTIEAEKSLSAFYTTVDTVKEFTRQKKDWPKSWKELDDFRRSNAQIFQDNWWPANVENLEFLIDLRFDVTADDFANGEISTDNFDLISQKANSQFVARGFSAESFIEEVAENLGAVSKTEPEKVSNDQKKVP